MLLAPLKYTLDAFFLCLCECVWICSFLHRLTWIWAGISWCWNIAETPKSQLLTDKSRAICTWRSHASRLWRFQGIGSWTSIKYYKQHMLPSTSYLIVFIMLTENPDRPWPGRLENIRRIWASSEKVWWVVYQWECNQCHQISIWHIQKRVEPTIVLIEYRIEHVQ